ncbi:MAG: hypothetical protein ABR927_02485 [Bacteroidales bacterium]|jgi:hypothetical protein
MYYELSKSQKKIARTVMDKGLENHYFKGLREVETIILNWQNGTFPNHKEAYMEMYKCVEKNDKHIAWLYNDKGGSRWVEVMAIQLADGVISVGDLKDFQEEVRDTIISWSKL